MSAAQNRAATKRVFDGLSRGDLAAPQKLLGGKLKQNAAEGARAAKAAFPDLHVHLDDVIAEGNKVVARWTAVGTHKGAGKHSLFGSVKPTGRQFRTSGITILRFENGRVAETWGVTDELSVARGLGLIRKRA